MPKICLALLIVIAALLGYQFVYKDIAYRRDVVARREGLLPIIKSGAARLAELEPEVKSCMDDLIKDRYHGERQKRCSPIIDERATLKRKTDAATGALIDLDAAVRRRYDGLPPAWW